MFLVDSGVWIDHLHRSDAELAAALDRADVCALALVDLHLLAAMLISPETVLWTRDKRLHSAAEQFGVASSAS